MPWSRLVVLVLFASGCLEAGLVPCGDRFCGQGSVCLEASEVCADEQVAGPCVGLAPGAACVVGGFTDATCQDGLCVRIACGNGVREVDEACDDGNNMSGDGCRSDCEVEGCGDGVLDPGEFCDCGVISTDQPPGCLGPNSDDPIAQCDTSCARHCGDGMITGLEECDGSNLAGATCQSIGFYYGAGLTCGAQCKLDVSACAGECGDGIVQGDQAEDCDGAPPASSCVDFGFDLGHVGCTSRCNANVIGDCDRFGWHAIRPGVASRVWSDGTRIATIENAQGYFFDGATWQHVAGSFEHIADNGVLVAFVGQDSIMRLGPTGFVAVSMPSTASAIIDADLLSDGRVALTRADNLVPFAPDPNPGFTCSVQVEPSWIAYPAISSSSCTTAILPDDSPVVLALDGRVFQLVGASWSQLGSVTTGGGMEIRRIGAEVMIAAEGLYAVGVSGLVSRRLGTLISVTGTSDGTLYASTGSSLERFDGREWSSMPMSAARLAGGGELVVSYGAGATQVLALGAWDAGESTPNLARRTIRLADAVVSVGPNGFYISAQAGWQQVSILNDTQRDAWGVSRADFWTAGSKGLTRFTSAGGSPPSIVQGPLALSAISVDGAVVAGVHVVAGVVSSGSAIFEVRSSTTTPVPANCLFASVAVDPAGNVFATGNCTGDGVVWAITGGLAELYRSPGKRLAFVIATANGTVIASGDAGVVQISTTAAPVVLRTTMTGEIAVADGRLVAIDPVDATGFAGLFDWDGATWAPVRIAPAGWKFLSYGGGELVVGNANQIRSLITYPDVPAALAP